MAETYDGSSPRVWGTCGFFHKMVVGMRFIPTGVGNIDFNHDRSCRVPVHPHGCGEHGDGAGGVVAAGGSSPRVWGTSIWRRRKKRMRRFIPTGVGNMRSPVARMILQTVHPHGCGEHGLALAVNSSACGSSPRVWGTLAVLPAQVLALRFIPTGVGNIAQPQGRPAAVLVHPHGCGEHMRCLAASRSAAGSSPRVWGTSIKSPSSTPRRRFIPTGVGNIQSSNANSPPSAVHPHGCGEHEAGAPLDGAQVGSSPRVWGTSAARPPS